MAQSLEQSQGKKQTPTNAEFIKAMYDINETYAAEHPNEPELLTPKVKDYLKQVIDQGEKLGDDPDIINLMFNKNLKPQQQ